MKGRMNETNDSLHIFILTYIMMHGPNQAVSGHIYSNHTTATKLWQVTIELQV